MPVALVQEADAASSSVNLGANATAGNTLVVAVACLSASPAAGVTGVTLGGGADNFAPVTPGPSAQDTASPNDVINVSVWTDPNCAGGSAAISVTGTGVVATWVWEVSGPSGAADLFQVFPVPTYQGSWVTALGQTTVPAEAWIALTCAANQAATETLTPNNVTGWTLQNAYNGTLGSYFWGAQAAYQTANTVGTPAWSGAFSQPSFSVTVLVTLPAAPLAAPAPAAPAGVAIAAGVSASAGGLNVTAGLNAAQVTTGLAAAQAAAGTPTAAVTAPVGLAPTSVKTGNYTARPGDFVIVEPLLANLNTVITFPSGAPTNSLVGVKLAQIAIGSTVTVQLQGADVFDAQPPGTNQVILRKTGATFIAQYRAAAGTWYIQSASYTEPAVLPASAAVGSLPGTPDANSAMAADVSFSTWSYDQAMLNSPFTGTALTSGKIYLVMCPVRSTMTIGSVVSWITSAGSGLTANQNFVGVYSAAGTKLLDSGDVTFNFGTAGLFTATAFSQGTMAPPFVWAALLSNGTTPPSFARTGNQTAAWANGNAPSGTPRFGTLSGTYTSLPSSFGVATPSAAAAMYWVGLI